MNQIREAKALIFENGLVSKADIIEVLVKKNFNVEICETVEQCFDAVKIKELMIAIISSKMGDEISKDIVACLSDIRPELRIIVVDNSGDIETERAIRENPVFAYFMDPIEKQYFEMAVDAAVRACFGGQKGDGHGGQ